MHHTCNPTTPRAESNETTNEGIMDSLFLAGLLRPLRIHQSRRVIVSQEANQVRRLFESLDAFLDFAEQAIGDVLGQYHLAGGRSRGCSG